MTGASKHNGHQAKSLMREAGARRRIALRDRRDRAVGLADWELGVRGQVSGFNNGALAPETSNLAPGYRGLPATDRVWAPLRPAGAPIPGNLSMGAASGAPTAVKGEFDATYGVSGTPITSGFLLDLGEYNPELMGRIAVPIYEKMRRSDAQVRATLVACKLPILSAKWEVVPEEQSAVGGRQTAAKAKEVAEFVKENLFGGLEFQSSAGGWVSQSWQSVIANALLMLDFGCAIHEDVWTADGDKIRLRSLPSRLPLTFYRWHTEADGETLLALEQYGYRGDQFLNALLPADKISRFTYQQEGANFWGIALQRAMYPHWYIKSKLYRLDAIANERNSLGVPVFRLAPGFSSQDKEAAYNYVTQLASHEATGLVEPPGDATTGFRIVGYAGRLRDVLPSIQHHNEMISRAALNTFMDLGQSAHGSRALGATATDFFMLGLQSVADQIAMAITHQTIRRLVALNFGDDAPCPKLVAGNVQARSVAEMTDDLVSMAQYGLIVSENNLRKHIREKLALPEEGAEGIVAIRGETIDVAGVVSAVSGRSAGAVDDAAKKPAGSVGAHAAARREQSAASSQQPADDAGPQKGFSGGVTASEKAGSRRQKAEGRSRTVQSPFWRDGDPERLRLVHPSETHIDFPAHDAALDAGEAAIARELAEWKPRLGRMAADRMAAALKRGADPNAVSITAPAQLLEAVEAELQRLYDEGLRQARAEDARLVMGSPGTVRLADDDKKRPATVGLIANLTTQDVAADIAQAARKAAIDLAREQIDFTSMNVGEIADRLFGAVDAAAYVDAGIERAAAEGAREAWNAGRAKQLESPLIDIQGDLYREIRIAMLDKNTCAPCAAADGQPWNPKIPLGTICEGEALCRCEPVRERIRKVA